MRLFPILTALLVVTGLYLLLFERQAVLDFARGATQTQTRTVAAAETGAARGPAGAETAGAQGAGTDDTPAAGRPVSVVAIRSQARRIDSAIRLFGRTEASRQVTVRAEISGRVISEPRRKGARVEAGETLCELDPGTRRVALAEARARLLEARARIPEAEARLSEAESRLPAARAALAEAEARLPTAEAGLTNARSQVAAAEAALAQARAQVPAAEARVREARARLEEAEAELSRARALRESGHAPQVRVDNAAAALESARAALQGALSQQEAARAGVETAKSQVEAARAGVQAALGQIEAARAGVETAKSQVEAARAGVQSARSGVENARAGVQSAEARIASVERDIENLTITAPFAGLLESDAAELGSLLQPGSPCATVVRLDPIRLVGFVSELEVGRIHTGTPAGGRLSDGREVTGTVTFVGRVSDPMTRTFRVEIEAANPGLTISGGLSAEMLIPSDGRLAHLLPLDALTLDDAGILGVRLVDDESRAAFAPVELIRDALEGVWVAGLPEEAAVIVVGQNYVTDGVALEVAWRESGT